MRFPRRARQRDDDQRILPLVNIVFLLLIFFMLAGRLAAPDPFAIEPPKSDSEDPANASGIVVHVGAGERLALDGEPIEPAALQAQVAQRLEAAPGTSVRLMADGGIAATRVVAIMQRLRKAGVERLRLLTAER